jgi:hypothetical protein
MECSQRGEKFRWSTRQQIVCDGWRVAKHYWNPAQRSAAAVGDDEWEWYVIFTLWSPLAASEEDLAANGYRWVSVDGPYGCPSKDDLRQITKHRTDEIKLRMVEQVRAYHLIPGRIVRLVQQDAASGMSQIH